MADPRVAFAVIGVCAGGLVVLLVLAMVASCVFAEDAGLPRAARRRARALFLSQLTPAQRNSWFWRRRFNAVAPSGRVYTIGAYRPFNICTHGAAFCVQVEGDVPLYDKMLAQKLLVESDEQRFLASANMRTSSRAWHDRVAAARRAA